MTVGRSARQAERRGRFEEVFGRRDARVALSLMELVEFAWHDCYGEVTPPDRVVEDMLVCSQGRLDRLIEFAWLAVIDARDLQLAAEALRGGGGAGGAAE